MSHGERVKWAESRPIERVSESSGSGIVVVEPQGSPNYGTCVTMSTSYDQGEGPSIKPYVSEIDHLVELFRAGERRSRFDVVASIIQLLNGDADLSPLGNVTGFQNRTGHSHG
jgi:hypothetical protein